MVRKDNFFNPVHVYQIYDAPLLLLRRRNGGTAGNAIRSQVRDDQPRAWAGHACEKIAQNNRESCSKMAFCLFVGVCAYALSVCNLV